MGAWSSVAQEYSNEPKAREEGEDVWRGLCSAHWTESYSLLRWSGLSQKEVGPEEHPSLMALLWSQTVSALLSLQLHVLPICFMLSPFLKLHAHVDLYGTADLLTFSPTVGSFFLKRTLLWNDAVASCSKVTSKEMHVLAVVVLEILQTNHTLSPAVLRILFSVLSSTFHVFDSKLPARKSRLQTHVYLQIRTQSQRSTYQ